MGKDKITEVNLPEYINEPMLNELLQNAGSLIGLVDFRPTFGMFQVVGFKKLW